MEIRGAGSEKGLRFSVRRLGGRGLSPVNQAEDEAQSVCLKAQRQYLSLMCDEDHHLSQMQEGKIPREAAQVRIIITIIIIKTIRTF